MEMKKELGVLCEKVDRLSGDIGGLDRKIDGFGDKLDKVKHWQTVVSTGGLVVAGIVAIIWSIITFVPWERIHIDTAPMVERSEKR